MLRFHIGFRRIRNILLSGGGYPPLRWGGVLRMEVGGGRANTVRPYGEVGVLRMEVGGFRDGRPVPYGGVGVLRMEVGGVRDGRPVPYGGDCFSIDY